MSDATNTYVRTVAKNGTKTIRVAVESNGAAGYVDLRCIDQRRPASAGDGFGFLPARLPQLIAALQDAQAECVRRGLLTNEEDAR